MVVFLPLNKVAQDKKPLPRPVQTSADAVCELVLRFVVLFCYTDDDYICFVIVYADNFKVIRTAQAA